MSKPARKSTESQGRQLGSEELKLVTGGALNAYLVIKGQKTGTLIEPNSSDSGSSSQP